MKSLWNSFKIAFAMFSKIPMPQADWSEENMRYMLCFFPFVGAAVGVVMLGMEWLCRYFGMSNGFIAVALVLVPVPAQRPAVQPCLLPAQPARVVMQRLAIR